MILLIVAAVASGLVGVSIGRSSAEREAAKSAAPVVCEQNKTEVSK